MDDTDLASADPTNEPYVFVSYSRADEKLARAVIATLEQAGFKIWWDGLIPGGERFSAKISEALEGAHAVVALWSASSLQSNWVQDEAAWARDHRRLVPLSLDGSDPPLGFRQLQCIDISRGGIRAANPQMQRAMAAIAELLGRTPEPPPATARAAPNGLSRRTALIGAGAVAVGGLGYGAWRFMGTPSGSSIAVLPFENLSGDPKQHYLSDGIAAELRSRLSRDPAIKVVGQASSNAVAEGTDRGPTIARKLGVANLLDGNLRAADGQVRIAVELIDGATGFSKWSQSFDRPIANLLELQDEVADAVFGALLPRLLGTSEEDRTRSGGTSNSAAYDLFLRGREEFELQTDEASDRAALASFAAAIALDPRYAAALAGQSRALAVVANQYEQAEGRRRSYAQAVEAARRAIAAAPEFPDGHAALGYALFYGMLDVSAADEPYRQALALGSGSADTLGLVALYRARRKQFDLARPTMDKALALDPMSAAQIKRKGRILFAAGDYRGAIAAAERSLALNPTMSGSRGDIGNAQLMLGEYDAAARSFAAETTTMLTLPGQAILSARTGRKDEAQSYLDRLVATEGDNGLYQQAQVHAQMGQASTALDRLDEALAAQDSGLSYLYSDPFLEPLYSEPRFNALLRRLHFV